MKELDEADLALAVAFVDGALADPERARFERRLAGDPALAAAVEELYALDEALRRRAASERARAGRAHSPPRPDERTSGPRVPATAPAPPRLLRRRSTWIALAATLLVALGIGIALSVERARRVEVQLALAPSHASPRRFLQDDPALAPLHPPGLEELRTSEAPPNVEARRFLELAASRERLLADAALAGGARELVAGHFVVPIAIDRDATVVVLAVPRVGPQARLWPEPGDAPPLAERGRLAAGSHVLPSDRFTLVEDATGERVDYHEGFLVPVGARELEVLVGVRRDPLDQETVAEIDAALARGGALEALDDLGFAVGTLRVVEPL